MHTTEFTKAASRTGCTVVRYPAAHSPAVPAVAEGAGGERPRRGLIREARHLGSAILKKLPGEWKAIKTNRPDVVLLRFGHYLSSVILCVVKGIPLVVEVNAPAKVENELLPPQRRFWLEPFHHYLYLRALRKASRIVAVSAPLKRYLAEAGVPAENVTVVPNGVDINTFSPSVSGQAVKRGLGIEGKTVLGFSGFFSPWHGIDFAVEGLRELLRAGDGGSAPVVLLLVGKAQPFTTMPSLSMPSIVSTGYVKYGEMPSYLGAIDIFIAPYPKIEPFYFSPLKILEAMAMGKPVVASAQGQITEMVEHGVSGLLYPPGDMPAFLECLRTLIADRNLREKMGRRGREIAEERYTWEHNARRILEVCEKLVRERRPSRRKP